MRDAPYEAGIVNVWLIETIIPLPLKEVFYGDVVGGDDDTACWSRFVSIVDIEFDAESCHDVLLCETRCSEER